MLEITKATIQDAKLISDFARPIWEQHYSTIISKKQIDYMLALFQSQPAIEKQIKQNIEYYIIKQQNYLAGYMAIKQQNTTLLINKFYLESQFRGQGIAKLMLNKIIEQAKSYQCVQLELTVNKLNPTFKIYLKLGFNIKQSVQIDIGEDFVMDDYLMVKTL